MWSVSQIQAYSARIGSFRPPFSSAKGLKDEDPFCGRSPWRTMGGTLAVWVGKLIRIAQGIR